MEATDDPATMHTATKVHDDMTSGAGVPTGIDGVTATWLSGVTGIAAGSSAGGERARPAAALTLSTSRVGEGHGFVGTLYAVDVFAAQESTGARGAEASTEAGSEGACRAACCTQYRKAAALTPGTAPRRGSPAAEAAAEARGGAPRRVGSCVVKFSAKTDRAEVVGVFAAGRFHHREVAFYSLPATASVAFARPRVFFASCSHCSGRWDDAQVAPLPLRLCGPDLGEGDASAAAGADADSASGAAAPSRPALSEAEVAAGVRMEGGLIVMEDLRGRGVVQDFAAGLSVAQAKAVVREAAKLHAGTWGAADDSDVAGSLSPICTPAFMAHLQGWVASNIDFALGMVDAYLVDHPEDGPFDEASRATLRALPDRFPEYRKLQREAGRVVVIHGDLWSSNALFVPVAAAEEATGRGSAEAGGRGAGDAGGKVEEVAAGSGAAKLPERKSAATGSASDRVAALVDFQCSCLDPNMNDLTFLLLASLPAPLRRRHERGIIAAYHESLVAALGGAASEAGKAYPLSAAEEDYRRAIPSGLMQCLGSPSCFKSDDPVRARALRDRLACAVIDGVAAIRGL